MASNGTTSDRHTEVLHWSKPVLAEADLLPVLNGHRKVVLNGRTVITPSARDYLKAQDIAVETEPCSQPGTWGFGQERPYPLIQSALQSLQREGITFRPFEEKDGLLCHWAKALAECIARGECQGGVILSDDPNLICCVANKVPGIRGAAVHSIQGAARATLNMGANLLAVEMPGRTWFEIRQILRLACSTTQPCPGDLATTLSQIDGQSHQEQHHENR